MVVGTLPAFCSDMHRLTICSLAAFALLTNTVAPSLAFAEPTVANTVAATHRIEAAAPASGTEAAAIESSDVARYAAAEAQQPKVADFKGGGSVVIIGSTTALIVLLLVLIIVL